MRQRINILNVRNLALSILDGIFSIAVLMVTSRTYLGSVNTVCLWTFACIYLILFNYFAFGKYAIGKLKKSNHKRKIIIVSFVITLILFFVLPFRYKDILNNNYFLTQSLNNQTVIVEPLGEKNELSTGYQICIEGIKEDGQDYNLFNISLPDKWEFIGGRPVTESFQAMPLTVTLDAEESYSIMIRRGPSTGKAKISIGSKSAVIDFYQETEQLRAEINLKAIIMQDGGYPKHLVAQIAYNIIFLQIVAEISLVFTVWLICFLEKERKLKEKEMNGNARKNK